jgi:hypothetical protein
MTKVNWRAELAKRPWWMNALLVFCAYMTFVYLPFDLFWKPVAEDQEVWFGILLGGWAAKLTEPLHWAIYAAGLYGFWNMRSWMHPWAALYVGQIGVGMFVWSLSDERGAGVWGGAIAAIPFLLLAVALWRAKLRFAAGSEPGPRPE